MRSIRTVFSVSVLKSLWDTLDSHVKEIRKQGQKKVTVSHLFEGMARKLSEDPEPLPIAPNRRVTIYEKAGAYNEEFPQTRNSLYVDGNVLQRLFNVYEKVTKDQFDEGTIIDANTLAQTVFYHFCQENGLEIDENYFNDEYFKRHYTYNDEQTIESLRQLAQLLGKSPTSREWREHRHRVEGPSESYITNRFGSFNKAKKLANLTTFESIGGETNA